MPKRVTMARAVLRDLADVVAGAGRHLAEDELFGRVAAEHHRQHLLEVGLAC